MQMQIGDALTAIILTGGQATRMRPLSLGCSKAMLPFFGKPLLAYVLRDLASTGFVKRVLLTHPGTYDDIRLYFGDNNSGLPIEYLPSRGWKGTAGAIVALLSESPKALSSPFLVVYGDSLLRMDYRALLEFHLNKHPSMTIACHRPSFEAFLFENTSSDRQRTNFGIADLQPNGLVTRFEEKPYLDMIASTFTHPVASAAVYVVDPESLRGVPGPERPNFDFAFDVIPWLVANGKKIAGLDITPGFRIDLGTLANYLSVHLAMLHGSVQMPDDSIAFRYHEHRASVHSAAKIISPVFLGAGAQIGDNTLLESAIIGDRCEIQKSAVVRESVLLAETVVETGAVVEGSILGPHAQISAGVIVPRGTVISGWSRIGGPELVLSRSKVQALFHETSRTRSGS